MVLWNSGNLMKKALQLDVPGQVIRLNQKCLKLFSEKYHEIALINFFKGPILASFLFSFGLFKQTLQLYIKYT